MRIAILSPIHTSFYSRLVTFLTHKEPQIEVVQIVVRNIWNWQRIKSEYKRDGVRLLKKVHRKLLWGENTAVASLENSIAALGDSVKLPGRSLVDLAKQLNIPLMTVNDHNEQQVQDTLATLNLDAIVFTGGGLVRKNILNISKLGVINCHAGLLPNYRGMDVVEWPIIEMNSFPPQTGMTLHIMDKGVDTGPILATKPLPFRPNETIKDFRLRIEPEMVQFMIEGIKRLEANKLKARPQVKEDGKQYFVMHPRIKELANKKLNIKPD
ncbi:MAG: formyltransferase family protein [Chloroflexota bacterium]